ncbi:unnamed protein product [Pleuronectes platessa]|uniref:Uncharacterized protein n=1 Tax=Pleuronectes platessa TaxID=8262 RepID=A0A9N7U4S0_PLEPL|nr:unnamed protein product [Pleuronectes platessa]
MGCEVDECPGERVEESRRRRITHESFTYPLYTLIQSLWGVLSIRLTLTRCPQSLPPYVSSLIIDNPDMPTHGAILIASFRLLPQPTNPLAYVPYVFVHPLYPHESI